MPNTQSLNIEHLINKKMIAHLDLHDISYEATKNNYVKDRHGNSITQFKLTIDFNQGTFEKEIILNEEGYQELEKDFLHAFRNHAMTYFETPSNFKVMVF